MNKILDYDRFMQEVSREPVIVRVHGREYTIPASIPALVPLMMARAERLQDDRERNAEYAKLVFAAADAMFGEKQMDDICAHGLTAEDLPGLIQKCFEVIQGQNAEEDDEEEYDDENSRITPVKEKRRGKK